MPVQLPMFTVTGALRRDARTGASDEGHISITQVFVALNIRSDRTCPLQRFVTNVRPGVVLHFLLLCGVPN